MRRLISSLFTLFFGIIPVFAQNTEVPDPNPTEWVIETYPFPGNELARGYSSTERGTLVVPKAPKENASEKEIEDFIRSSNSVVSHYLKSKGLLLPTGGLVVFDPDTLTLTARLPRIFQRSIAFTSEDYLSSIEKYIGMEKIIIEAPVDLMRGIVKRAGQNSDHTPLLVELEKAVEEGKATILDSARLDVRSGNRAKISHSGSTVSGNPVSINKDDTVVYGSDESNFGNEFETEAFLGPDDKTIDFNIVVDHRYAPAILKKVTISRRGKSNVTASVYDRFKATISSQYTTRDGRTKMLATWKPERLSTNPADEVLQAAFVTTHVVRVLPISNNRLKTYLEKFGEKVAPIPKGELEVKKEEEVIPKGMIVRRYLVPPTFLNGGASKAPNAVEPFAPEPAYEPRFMTQTTAKDILKNAGIEFPPGSSANYLRGSSILVVRNFIEQIELVEAYIMPHHVGPEKSIAITAHIVQGPGKLMREASRQGRTIADHSQIWNDLNSQKEISILTTNWIEARSGNRAKVEAGQHFHYPTGAAVDKTEKSKEKENIDISQNRLSAEFDNKLVGTTFEVDPVLGADNVTIDLNFQISHDFAPPEETHQLEITPETINLAGPTFTFHEATVATQLTMRTGSVRMAGMWSPKGTAEFDNADIIQAVFIKAEILRLDDFEEAWDGL